MGAEEVRSKDPSKAGYSLTFSLLAWLPILAIAYSFDALGSAARDPEI